MNLRKFVAATTRDCLRQLRETLGDDALIISTRKVPQGIEVIGARASDMDAVQAHVAAPLTDEARVLGGYEMSDQEDDATAVRLSPKAHYLSERTTAAPPRIERGPAAAAAPLSTQRAIQPNTSPKLDSNLNFDSISSRKIAATPPRPSFEERAQRDFPVQRSAMFSSAAQPEDTLPDWLQQVRKQREAPTPATPSPAHKLGLDDAGSVSMSTARADEQALLIKEFHTLKAWMQKEVSTLCWRDATQSHESARLIWQRLVESGFSPALARSAMTLAPVQLDNAQADQWLQELIVKNLHVRSGADDLVEQGGVFALVGPTGVGKTTTVAKIAARCVARHGVESLGLITTDQYRIGAVDQLRTYGRLLGIDVYAARDREDLQTMLKCMSGRHLVLIDTVGISQKDSKLAQQLGRLDLPSIKRVLVVPASSSPDQCEEIHEGYRPGGLVGLIASKLDEAVRIGGTLDLAMRHRLQLQYVTSGQRVPEDLHLANSAMLVHRALKARPRSLGGMTADEIEWAAVPSL